MFKKIKYSLFCGFGIFTVCAFFSLLNAGWPLFWVVFLAPGISYGIALSADVESKYSPVLFVTVSTALYIACFCIVHPGRDDDSLIPRIFLASATGSLLLFVSYFLIISRNFPFWTTLLYSLLTGIISAIPACICYHYFAETRGESKLLYIGVFSIYPIWQFAFSILINACHTPPVIHTRANPDTCVDEEL